MSATLAGRERSGARSSDAAPRIALDVHSREELAVWYRRAYPEQFWSDDEVPIFSTTRSALAGRPSEFSIAFTTADCMIAARITRRTPRPQHDRPSQRRRRRQQCVPGRLMRPRQRVARGGRAGIAHLR